MIKTDDIRRYYSERYKVYGRDERSLGWTKHKQDHRFGQLLRFLSPAGGESLLDAGCGFGDLLSYMEADERFRDVVYRGMDLVPEFIMTARKIHGGGTDDRFVSGDFLRDEPPAPGRFDYVIASGMFGAFQPHEDEEEEYRHVGAVMERALSLAGRGTAMNFLSDKVDYRTGARDFHASPERVLGLAYRHSRRVILDNSAMPFEFTLTIFKDDGFREETTMFDAYLAERRRP